MIRPQSASSSTEEVFFTAGIPPRKILETEPSTSKENSEKESLMEPFFFIETGLFRRVARSSKERRSKVLWTLSLKGDNNILSKRERGVPHHKDKRIWNFSLCHSHRGGKGFGWRNFRSERKELLRDRTGRRRGEMQGLSFSRQSRFFRTFLVRDDDFINFN